MKANPFAILIYCAAFLLMCFFIGAYRVWGPIGVMMLFGSCCLTVLVALIVAIGSGVMDTRMRGKNPFE